MSALTHQKHQHALEGMATCGVQEESAARGTHTMLVSRVLIL